jgi:hypothetical protein
MEIDTISAEVAASESDHASRHKSASRMELITRGERRRQWRVEQKQTIATQSSTPVHHRQRRHGIGTGQRDT